MCEKYFGGFGLTYSKALAKIFAALASGPKESENNGTLTMLGYSNIPNAGAENQQHTTRTKKHKNVWPVFAAVGGAFPRIGAALYPSVCVCARARGRGVSYHFLSPDGSCLLLPLSEHCRASIVFS